MPPQSPPENLAERLFRELERQILADEFRAGERLPSERQLSQILEANRNTLREALRKLEQRQLVTVRHGQGVTVTDFRKDGLLDILEPFLRHGRDGRERVQVVADLLRVRAVLIELVVVLATERADAEHVRSLSELAELQIAHFDRGDRPSLARGDVAWLDAVVDAAGSLMVRWFANTILGIYQELAERFPAVWLLEPSYPEHMRELIRALDTRDAALAREAVRSYYARNDARVLDVLAHIADNLAAPAAAKDEEEERDGLSR